MGPRQIIIIRHGEKPRDKDNFGLSQQGFARSKYLVDYFTDPVIINGKQMYQRPQMIYCFNTHDGVNRSRQSMQPLIDTGIQYDDELSNGKSGTQSLVDQIFDDKNQNKTILVCWEHKIIPFLVEEIGKRMSKNENQNKNRFKDFNFWALDPKNGEKGENDHSLYSMTVIIDLTENTLQCINQSTDFNKNSQVLKKEKDYHILFSL
jgi:hypothetical protein